MTAAFNVVSEEVRHLMEWLIRHLNKGGAKIRYHSKRWRAYVTPTFPLAHHYQAVLGYG